MGDVYYFFKAFHLIAMVTWFAGLFYLFRLFVYHVEQRDKPEVTAVLKIMARRLYKIITVPGMIATWVFGSGMLVLTPSLLNQTWLQIKLLFLGGLSLYTLFVGLTRARFERDDIRWTSKQCRLWNEVPTLFLLIIVLLAVYRYKLLGG